MAFSANVGWRDLALGERLAEHAGLPVSVTHGVRAGGLAEPVMGAGRGVRDHPTNCSCRSARHRRRDVRYQRAAATAEQLINGARRGRPPAFAEVVPYLRQRVAEDDVVNAAQLYAELRALGHRVSRRTVRRYVEPLRAGLTTSQLPPPPPTVREVTRWITTHPDRLTDDEKDQLAVILDRSPGLAALDQHVTAFAEMMVNRTGATRLESWLAAVEADDLPALHSFAKGIDRDLDAVTNGLSLPHSSGAVEGNVTRIKAFKRARYGRANLDLLRKLILCAH